MSAAPAALRWPVLPGERIIAAAIKHYGRLDILVNHSGVYEFSAIEAITEEQFHQSLNVNVLGRSSLPAAARKRVLPQWNQ